MFNQQLPKREQNELIINGQNGSRKKGTYFQIMDDFLNFFKTSLFWRPIRGCSLKQRLKEKKHSCSNTINAVAVQKNLPQKWHNGTHQKSQTIKATRQSKYPPIQMSVRRSAYSLPAVVEVAAVTGVALHTQVAGGARWWLTGHLEVKDYFIVPSLWVDFWLLTMSLYNFIQFDSMGQTHALRMNFCEQKVKYVFLTSRSDAVSLEWYSQRPAYRGLRSCSAINNMFNIFHCTIHRWSSYKHTHTKKDSYWMSGAWTTAVLIVINCEIKLQLGKAVDCAPPFQDHWAPEKNPGSLC